MPTWGVPLIDGRAKLTGAPPPHVEAPEATPVTNMIETAAAARAARRPMTRSPSGPDQIRLIPQMGEGYQLAPAIALEALPEGVSPHP